MDQFKLKSYTQYGFIRNSVIVSNLRHCLVVFLNFQKNIYLKIAQKLSIDSYKTILKIEIMPHYNTKSEVEEGKNIYRNQYAGTTNKFSAKHHLLLVWGGSCYKLIWYQISIWLCCYTFLSVLYRNVLFNYPRHRQMFEMICIYAERFSGLVPITFITGFYVTQVVSRWWDQFMSLPWPGRLALKLVTNIPNGAVSMDLDLP